MAARLVKWLHGDAPGPVLLCPDMVGNEITRDARRRIIVKDKAED